MLKIYPKNRGILLFLGQIRKLIHPAPMNVKNLDQLFQSLIKQKYFGLGIFFVLGLALTQAQTDLPDQSESFLTIDEIRVRDPFILADKNSQTYYLYASIHNRTNDEGQGVEVYTSKDLKSWSTPTTVFKVPPDFWATKWVWAPEVQHYKGKYYLFTTFTSYELLEDPPVKPTESWPPFYKRGSQVLVSDSPMGPFRPFDNAPHTSLEEMTLDGTLWVEDDIPYMIYCHEWVQIKEGTINLVELQKDLSQPVGKSQILMKASEAPWVEPIANGHGWITDGCYLYRTKSGTLMMIWSSRGATGYSIGTAISTSGSIKGPWKHQPERLFNKDGGHGMIFQSFEGQLILSLHQPNISPQERMRLYTLIDTGEVLKLGELYYHQE